MGNLLAYTHTCWWYDKKAFSHTVWCNWIPIEMWVLLSEQLEQQVWVHNKQFGHPYRHVAKDVFCIMLIADVMSWSFRDLFNGFLLFE